MGRLDLSEAVKSNTSKKLVRGMAHKYINQCINTLANDLSRKIAPKVGGNFDIYKMIGKLPKP